jgi:muramoyltetrapeptide carboxypeptidase
MTRSSVGIWAGSSPAKKSEIAKGLRILDSWSVDPVIPAQTRRYASAPQSSVHSFLAGPDSAKLASLESLWKNSRIEKIMAVRGGAGSLRLLEAMDRQSFLKKEGKELWGFSDLTSVQNFLFFKYGHPWVHSPMLTSNALLEANAQEQKAWKSALRSNRAQARLVCRPLHSPKRARRSPGRGKIFGGNLSCLTTLAGGPWDRKISGNRILFLEEVNERDYRVDRILTQLSNSRFFSTVDTVILGHFTNCPKAEKIILDWAKRRDLFLFAGIKSGHDRPNLPLSMGVDARLEFESQNSAILELPAPRLR